MLIFSLLLKSRQRGLPGLLYSGEHGRVLGNLLVPLRLQPLDYRLEKMDFFLASGELAFGDFLMVFKFPVDFVFAFLQLEAFLGKLLGHSVQLSLAFGFLGEKVGLQRGDFRVPVLRVCRSTAL